MPWEMPDTDGGMYLVMEVFGVVLYFLCAIFVVGRNIPEAVILELNDQGQTWPGYLETSQATWITKHSVQNTALVTALRSDLGAGESEAIALALELKAGFYLSQEVYSSALNLAGER